MDVLDTIDKVTLASPERKEWLKKKGAVSDIIGICKETLFEYPLGCKR